MATIAEITERATAYCEKHGWNAPGRSMEEWVALFHSEVSELYEEWRSRHEPNEIYYADGAFGYNDKAKPEGIPIELADLVIRAFHFAYYFGIDLEAAIDRKMTYNDTRPYKHGNKRS